MKETMMRFLFAALLSVLAAPTMAQMQPQTFNLYSTPQPDQSFTDPAGNTTVFHTLGTAQNPVQTGVITFTPAAPPPPPPNIAVSNSVGGGCAGGTPSPTCASPPYSVVSGHQYIVAERAYGGSGQLTGIAGTGLSCALAPGPGPTGGARTAPGDAVKIELWRCAASSTASTPITATWNATVQWSGFGVMDVTGLVASPDDGTGNVAHGTGQSVTVSTAVNTMIANELIVAAFYDQDSFTGISAGPGYTLAAGGQMEYSLSNTAGPNSASVTITGNASGSPINAVIAAFK